MPEPDLLSGLHELPGGFLDGARAREVTPSVRGDPDVGLVRGVGNVEREAPLGLGLDDAGGDAQPVPGLGGGLRVLDDLAAVDDYALGAVFDGDAQKAS